MTTFAALPAAAVRALRHHLGPDRVLAEPDEIDVGRRVWNAGVSTRPALIARCSSTEDVRTVVRVARGVAAPVSVRSGGHDPWGRAVVGGGVVVDVSGIGSIEIDARTRTARIGGGVTSQALADAAEPAGLVPVTGTVGSVGMVGITLGGGYGPLGGRFGLACDNLLSAELVTADGDVVEVDADHEPDLLWALRGGGGNFGVVTSAVLRLHEVGPAHTGMVAYPWTRATDVLTGLAEVLDEAPDELSVQTLAGTGPDGARIVGLLPTWSGAAEHGPAAVAPLTRLGEPLFAAVDPVPWTRSLRDMAAMFPAGRHVRIRTRNVAGFSPAVVDALVAAGDTITSPLSAVSIHPFHGAATRRTAADAVFGERRPHQMVEIIALWEPGDDAGAADAGWADRAHAALGPHALPGGYPNLLTADDTAQVQAAYGAGTARLLEVKARVDPDGVFTATPLPRPAAPSHR